MYTSLAQDAIGPIPFLAISMHLDSEQGYTYCSTEPCPSLYAPSPHIYTGGE